MLTKVGNDYVEAIAIVSGGNDDRGGLPWHAFLTASGDGQGASNLNGNYAVATDFYYQAVTKFVIHSVYACIADATAMNQVDYGAISNGLTNGITLWIRLSSGIELPILGGLVIKTNQDWLDATPDALLSAFPGTPQSFVPKFDLVGGYGCPITLNAGDSFRVRLHDNFTGLVDHTFALRGIRF